MTPAERDAALQYLKDPKLSERIVADFRKCGLVGERATVLTAYLAAVSRKLSEPLAVLIVARSGAGKSALQDALCAFVPPEEAVRVTRLTGQALFYKDPYSLSYRATSTGPGGLVEYYFPYGTPAGSVGPPTPVPSFRNP